MPFAVTHVILTIIIIDLYRDYITKHRTYFSLHTVLIGGIAGLLPDIDVPLAWILGSSNIVHGSFTHTLFFALIFLAIGFLFSKDMKKAALFYVIGFGIFFHIFLDWFLGGGMQEGVMWFYPFSLYVSKFHLLSRIGFYNLPAAIDAIILLAWLWHEEVKHKIRDFI